MKSSPRFSLALFAGDLASVLVAFNLVAIARGLTVLESPIFWPLLVPAFFLTAALALIEGYSPRTDLLSLEYTSQHLIAVFAAALGTLLVTHVVITSGFTLQQSRLVSTLGFLIVTPLGLASRRLLALRRTAVRRDHSVIFVGDEAAAWAFGAECIRVGFERPILNATLDEAAATPERPALAELVSRIESGAFHAEAIVLRESARDLPAGLPDRLVQLHFAGVPTYTLELFHEVVWRKIPLYRINPAWLFQGGFQLAREPIFERLKRISDLLLALVVLVGSAPFLALAALAIVIDDRGPIFFRQSRIGRHRQPFTLFKLRTMRVAEGGARYTAPGDKRITRVGAFLRASRLDELPQLWNVLKGDMSMIGPRAEWDVLVRDYEAQIPCYHFRHLVRPGITGWAQINYPYGASLGDTLRKLEYDLYYIRHYSFRLDASITLKTIHVMLFGKGSR
ncbi:MAG: exopolysaccharide biosynthesis polyprenyl glycosylphosphotransferase [Burkholderiales bacterium]|nr:exopolysaccharide biosynthesis polyprenyl glycosylphosphotransferase [Opitutaceae bacterium]